MLAVVVSGSYIKLCLYHAELWVHGIWKPRHRAESSGRAREYNIPPSLLLSSWHGLGLSSRHGLSQGNNAVNPAFTQTHVQHCAIVHFTLCWFHTVDWATQSACGL